MTTAAVYARKSTEQGGVSDDAKSVARQIERVLERHLVAVLVRAEDTALLSTDAATADAPAGLREGVSATATGGTLADDVAALADAVRNGAPIAPTFVTSLAGLVALAGAHLLGADGTLAGVPVVQSASAGARLILIDGAAVGVADAGLIVDNGPDAAAEFSGTPNGTGPLVSAFASNLAMLRLTRYVSWACAYADAAAYLNLTLSVGSPA